MKLRIFTFLLIAAAGLSACKKENADIDINQYDQQQIENYIAANNLTDFKRDTTSGDTSGIYYKIFNKGVGAPLEYSDMVSLVFTVKSFDGKYVAADTITNHYYNFLGYLTRTNLPITQGLQQAIHDVLKYRDGSMRVLIPSHLAFGQAGYGSGSITNVNTRIAGNQSLDYYVHVINDQQVYDDLVIRNYMTANSFSGYNKTASGVYYKVTAAGNGAAVINGTSAFTADYTLKFLNNSIIQTSPAVSFTTENTIPGVKEVLTGQSVGSKVSILIPSRSAYGIGGNGSSIPPNSCLYYDFTIITVTN